MSETVFPLAAALEYRNPDVLDSFLETYAMPRDEAELLFEDVRRWLWLAARAEDRQSGLFVDAKMILFDEMWHTFVLFTRDYAEFCEKYLGRFCHHTPATTALRAETARRVREEPEAFAKELRDQYTTMITLVVNELGEEVATRWFETYRHRHTAEYIRSIHKYGRQPLAAAQQ